MTLSFCITCKNRFDQISKTLPINLNNNKNNNKNIEFILIDFGSTDGLRDWILSNFTDELESGYLKYYYTEELKYWHSCIGKNTAHLFAKNDIVVNLDCDNYTGVGGGDFLIKEFGDNIHNKIIHQFSGSGKDGTYGRISMSRKNFNILGGYDESFLPMGDQDNDIIGRAILYGLEKKIISNKKYLSAITNSKEESIKNTNTKLSYKDMRIFNRKKMRYNIKNNIITVNNGVFGISKNIINSKDLINKTALDFDNFGSKEWKKKWNIPKMIGQDRAEIVNNCLRVSYKKNKFGVMQTGINFPLIFPNLYNELYLKYYVKFEKGFDFSKGGKLPGLMGGENSYKCSGGNQPNGLNGWTIRFMWREKGELVIYSYTPKSKNGKWGGYEWGQDIPCNLKLDTDKWYCIEEYINIGTPDTDNGTLKVWINGEKKLDINDLYFSKIDNNHSKIGGILFSTFHGGQTREWSPNINSFTCFKNFTISVLKIE